jgi:predicted ATPase
MSEIPFYRTRMGQVFFDRTMPELMDALKSISGHLKRLADGLERREVVERTPSEPSNDGGER